MRRSFPLVVALMLCADPASAKTVTRLTRRLTPAQSAAFTSALASVAKEVIAGARRAGPSCEVWSTLGTTAVRAVDLAHATSAGLAPIIDDLRLRCGEGRPSIRISVSVDEGIRQMNGPPRDAPVPNGLTVRLPKDPRRAVDPSTTFVQSDAALIRIDVEGEGRPGAIGAQLDQQALVALTRAFAALRLPPRAPSSDAGAVVVGARDEQAVMLAVMKQQLRGEGVVVSARPLELVALDVEALTRIAPDLDPSLFEEVVRRRHGSLPSLPANATVVEQPDLDAVFAKRLPGGPGVLHVSPIAFSRDGRQAAVTTRWRFGPTDGIDLFQVLERSADGSWSVLYESKLA